MVRVGRPELGSGRRLRRRHRMSVTTNVAFVVDAPRPPRPVDAADIGVSALDQDLRVRPMLDSEINKPGWTRSETPQVRAGASCRIGARIRGLCTQLVTTRTLKSYLRARWSL
jgi:hypothetical protein